MKYKQNIIFTANGKKHFLFQIMNIGKNADDFKFNFNDNKASISIIHSRNTGTIDKDALINPYGESTYHSDGTFMFKFPNYPIKEKQYYNPHGVGERRRPLTEIDDFEPLFNLEVYQYRLCQKIGNLKDKYEIDNVPFFNGTPFGCVIMLLSYKYEDFQEIKDESSISIRLRRIGENIDLGLIFGKLNRSGKMVFIPELNQSIFTDNNYIEIVEKK